MKMLSTVNFTLFFATFIRVTFSARLEVSGTDLIYNGQKTFLNGVNIAWGNYGYDFGNGDYDGSLEVPLQEIGAAGGNSALIWVHVEGFSTPIFDSNGYVTSCDATGDFTNDVLSFLNAAQSNNILVILALWNGAFLTNDNAINLVWDDSKLDSYINNCLNGFVQAVAGHPALGAWEAVNEPEGSILVASDGESCYDTTVIGESGAGWANNYIPMERYLRFIGRLNMAIRENDPTGLVTLGSWGQFAQSDAFSNTKNHYSDECLNMAAGGSNAGLDFYQMHTYDWDGSWSANAPFTVNSWDYGLDKPLIIGEYASVCAAGTSLKDLYEYAYTHGYAGGLSWRWEGVGECSDTRDAQRDALGQLAQRTENGIVDITVG